MRDENLKPTGAKELLGLGALHGPLLLKLQHRRPEDLLDLLRDVPPGLVVLCLGCAARLHLKAARGQLRRRTFMAEMRLFVFRKGSIKCSQLRNIHLRLHLH